MARQLNWNKAKSRQVVNATLRAHRDKAAYQNDVVKAQLKKSPKEIAEEVFAKPNQREVSILKAVAEPAPLKSSIKNIKLENLKTNYFVRHHIDEDNVLKLMELIDTGTKLPPIKIHAKSLEIIDGRHRSEAYRHLGKTEVECELIDGDLTKEDILFLGFEANYSQGPLPMTREDVLLVMRQMLEANVSHIKIMAQFAPKYYAKSHARKLLKDAYSTILKQKKSKAINAVTEDGLTINEAASKFNLDVEQLKEEITGIRKKKKKRTGDKKSIMTRMSNRARSNTHKALAEVKHLFDRYEDGEILKKDVKDVIAHFQHVCNSGIKSAEGWLKRLNNIS